MSNSNNYHTPMTKFNLDLLSNLPEDHLRRLVNLCSSEKNDSNLPSNTPISPPKTDRAEVRLPK
ncbi:hypothetical protein OnM2_023067 [Erysiphe neolycopersici]|uniref:Uncharacterized protein n=1 Tax=Erysiphe neolycopersici TaxID=212602 RepID=A0A420I2F2_9PEZI|nr:hypothetical protein OnM2_023067 [Erysiphe neolycopersici]